MILRVISIFLLISCFFASEYIGGDIYTYFNKNVKGDYIFEFNGAYLEEANTKIFNNISLKYNLLDDLYLDIRKEYYSGRVTLGLMYTFLNYLDSLYMGCGFKKIGVHDYDTPYAREYIISSVHIPWFKLSLGLQRIIEDDQNSLNKPFGGIETDFLDYMSFFAYYDYGYYSLGFKYKIFSGLDFSVSQYSFTNDEEEQEKLLEIGFVFSGNLLDSLVDISTGNLTPTSSVKTAALDLINKKYEQGIISLNNKIKSIEQSYNENIQNILINEKMKKEYKETEPLRLKAALNHIQKGLEYYYSGDLKNAEYEYKLVSSLYPEMPLIHERIGSIYYQMGYYDKAKKEWLLALSLNPGAEHIKKYLKMLEEINDKYKPGNKNKELEYDN